MKLLSIPLFAMCAMMALSPLARAQQTPDWENPAVFQINKEPVRATFIPFADVKSVVADDYTRSPWYMNLNGMWKFQWSPTLRRSVRSIFTKPISTFVTGKRLRCLPTGNSKAMVFLFIPILLILFLKTRLLSIMPIILSDRIVANLICRKTGTVAVCFYTSKPVHRPCMFG
jgi:hypothetical protein